MRELQETLVNYSTFSKCVTISWQFCFVRNNTIQISAPGDKLPCLELNIYLIRRKISKSNI